MEDRHFEAYRGIDYLSEWVRFRRYLYILVFRLGDRAGFDSWWNTIDTNTRNDLEDTLKLKVNAQLEAH